jgi:hypothetical protein
MDLVKLVQVFSSIAGIVAAFWALWVYRSNSQRERARWAESLYSKFFERDQLKRVRDLLDCNPGDQQVSDLVNKETSDYTDYLNFFEFVAYLQASKQLSNKDVEALFGYYLGCLNRHSDVTQYIRDEKKGYEYLRKLLP